MKSIDFGHVTLDPGYWLDKEILNRKITINSVYEQFDETGRIKAFDCSYREGEENRPHYFWDSDVAKWMEGAAYILSRHQDARLEERLDSLISKIKLHQGYDGYFNIYFTAVEPSMRFQKRSNHELYCAGHLIEAAIACDQIGKPDLLACMKKYIAYIHQIFVVEKSAAFSSPGHEEIELALVRLSRYTKDSFYLDLAAHFINMRGTAEDVQDHFEHNQSHLPVREQEEAVGHAVRALYLYTGMAMLAKDTQDNTLLAACRTLFEDIISRKMYVTGGVGSTSIGESFTNPFDLPNDTAYAETCAAIAMMFFGRALSENEPDSRYADVIERAFYNNVLSGISLDGKRFFYENTLEINLNEHFENDYGKPRYPITLRPEIFGCSCCPPNLNRLLSSLGGYLFGLEDDTLYIHQYTAAHMEQDSVSCTMKTRYPMDGEVSLTASGVSVLALRIPGWCSSFQCSHPYEMKHGYACIKNDGATVTISFDMRPKAVFANSHAARDTYKLCVMRGPVVYCAEAIDNQNELYRYSVSPDFTWKVNFNTASGLPELDISAYYLEDNASLYFQSIPVKTEASLHLIPYSSFANRAEYDMAVWLHALI